MNIHSLSLHAIVVGAALASSGCASIISGRTATVQIDSNPSNAQVVIHDKHGKEVITTHTPASVELRRKDKFIWPAKYTATIDKPGYKTAIVPINSTRQSLGGRQRRGGRRDRTGGGQRDRRGMEAEGGVDPTAARADVRGGAAAGARR